MQQTKYEDSKTLIIYFDKLVTFKELPQKYKLQYIDFNNKCICFSKTS